MWSKYQMKGSFYSCLYMVLRYYVLIQQLCPTLLCRLFKEELERAGVRDVDKRLQKEFPKWFKRHVSILMHVLMAVGIMRRFHFSGPEFFYCTWFANFRSGSFKKRNQKTLAKGCLSCHVDLILESRLVKLAA